MHPDKAFTVLFQYRAVGEVGIGIGSIENDQRNSIFGASLHDIVEGGKVGVKPYAYILQIEKHNAEPFQAFF